VFVYSRKDLDSDWKELGFFPIGETTPNLEGYKFHPLEIYRFSNT
jgi:hypothetical protein